MYCYLYCTVSNINVLKCHCCVLVSFALNWKHPVCRTILMSIFTHSPLRHNLNWSFNSSIWLLTRWPTVRKKEKGATPTSHPLMSEPKDRKFPRSPCFSAYFPWHLIGPTQVTWLFLVTGEVRKQIFSRKEIVMTVSAQHWLVHWIYCKMNNGRVRLDRGE